MNFDEIFFHQKLKILAEKTETFFFIFASLFQDQVGLDWNPIENGTATFNQILLT